MGFRWGFPNVSKCGVVLVNLEAWGTALRFNSQIAQRNKASIMAPLKPVRQTVGKERFCLLFDIMDLETDVSGFKAWRLLKN